MVCIHYSSFHFIRESPLIKKTKQKKQDTIDLNFINTSIKASGMSRQNVWILSRAKAMELNGRQYCHTKSQREALLLLSPLVVTHLQCRIAIREPHKNKIRLNAHDRRQTLRLESSVWQARVIYCDCMIYLASQSQAESFLIPFTIISTAISQRCRERRLCMSAR